MLKLKWGDRIDFFVVLRLLLDIVRVWIFLFRVGFLPLKSLQITVLHCVRMIYVKSLTKRFILKAIL